MFWAIGQVAGRQGVSFIVFYVLSLLLSPYEIGVVGLAMTWLMFIQVFSELGFGAALIQKEEINEQHKVSIYFVNLFLGAFLTLAGIALAPICADFFRTPEIKPVMTMLSLNFIINSFSLMQTAILQRELRFKELALRDIISTIIGGCIGIIMAVCGSGVWSLVVQTLVSNIIGCILIIKFSRWIPRATIFSKDCIIEMWDYSSKILLFNLLKYFAQNTDKLLIGYLLGTVSLGLYTFAYKIVTLPIVTLVGAGGNYLFAKYSRMQNDKLSIKNSFIFVSKTISSIISPIMIIIVFLFPQLIEVLFGEKWGAVIPLIPILAILSIVMSLVSPFGQLMKSLNRPQLLCWWGVAITIVSSMFICAGSVWGLAGSASGLLISYIICLPFTLLIIRSLLRINIYNYLKSLFPSISGAIIMSVVLGVLYSSSISLIVKLIGAFFSLVMFIGILYLFDRSFFVQTINILRRIPK